MVVGHVEAAAVAVQGGLVGEEGQRVHSRRIEAQGREVSVHGGGEQQLCLRLIAARRARVSGLVGRGAS